MDMIMMSLSFKHKFKFVHFINIIEIYIETSCTINISNIVNLASCKFDLRDAI